MARPKANTEKEVMIPETDMSLELEDLRAQVAMELAAGLSDASAVKGRYGISDAQWEVLKRNPTFRGMLKEAIERLKGDMNAGKRIIYKAETLLEDALPVLDEIAHERSNPPAARIDAIKTMAQMAGKTNKEGTANTGGMFALSINIGNGTPNIVLEGKALPEPSDDK